MAGLTSGDRPSNGALEGQQDSSAAASRGRENAQSDSIRERRLADTDRSGADGDQHAAPGKDVAGERDEVISDDNGEYGGDQAAMLEHRALERQDAASAAADREHAADDRKQAARDRAHAQVDRDTLQREVAAAEASHLADPRLAGLAELDCEIDRARRSRTPLVVAYVDLVDPLRTDADAHGTRDALLLRVVCAIRDRLRSYDLIVRLSGDALLCVMSGASTEASCPRLAAVQAAFAGDPDAGEIRVGFASLAPADSAAELIERAVAGLSTTHAVGFP